MRIHSAVIRYFDEVRRAGSIREAARRLNVASSAVNRQILNLEAEVGAPLFERRPTGMKLTAAGEVVARHVIVVLQDLERAQSDISALKGARIGHVSVVAIEGVSADLLPRTIAKMREVAPRVTLDVEIKSSLQILDAIAQGEADVGIAFSLPRSTDLRQVVVERFKLGAIMAPSHPLASRHSVPITACLDYPIFLAHPSLSINWLLHPVLSRLPIPISPALTTTSIELMRELTERGLGIAFQTRVGIEHRIAEGMLVHVPLESKGPIWSELGVYVRAGRNVPTAVDLFLQILVREIQLRAEAEHSPGS